MSSTQLIKIACSLVYFLPNKKKYLQRIYAWIYRADTLYSSEDWIDLDQDRTKWQAVVCTVMKVIFQITGNFLQTEEICTKDFIILVP